MTKLTTATTTIVWRSTSFKVAMTADVHGALILPLLQWTHTTSLHFLSMTSPEWQWSQVLRLVVLLRRGKGLLGSHQAVSPSPNLVIDLISWCYHCNCILSNVFSCVLNFAIDSITFLLAETLAYREVAFSNKHIHWYSYLDGERHYKNFQRTLRSDRIQGPFPDAFPTQ